MTRTRARRTAGIRSRTWRDGMRTSAALLSRPTDRAYRPWTAFANPSSWRRSPARAPVERLIGTVRREFLDQVPFWNARDLERKLAEFQTYYNAARGHASLAGHTPLAFASGHTTLPADLNHVRWVSHRRGLSFPSPPDTNSRRTG